MGDREFDMLIKKEFSALTLDKLKMFSEGEMFSYEDLQAIYEFGKKVVLRWTPVSIMMPENNIPVLAFGKSSYGKGSIIRASYIAPYTVEDEIGSFVEDADYSESEDKCYVPGGWYERNLFEDTHWMVDIDITHWQPLPPPPEEERK